MESKYETCAKLPIDGLFGGFFTTRKSTDPKYDGNTMWNKKPCNLQVTYDACSELTLCPVVFKETVIELHPAKIRCGLYDWERWGDWSGCDKKCGKTGRRIRKRKCINRCTNKEGEGKCPASKPTPTKPALTDTDETKCSPCPPQDEPLWDQWTKWSFTKEGNYCGTGTKQQERKRSCEFQGRKAKGKCDGEDRETREFKLNACPTVKHNAGGGVNDYPEDNGNVDDDEAQGDEGDEDGNLDTDDNVDNEMDGDAEDDEATEDEVVELEDEVGEEDVTENSGLDEGENGGGEEEAIDGMDPDTDDVGEDEDNSNDKDNEDEGDDNDGGDDGAGDDGGDYNFHGGDGEDYPDSEDSFDFGQ